jgi:uncharacterized DUF497 family protein
MKIERVVWLKEIVDKLARKHHVLPEEVEQALSSKPRFYLVQRGERAGEDVYMALGQTDAGRYLTVLFIYKKRTKEAIILSARDMAKKERKRYEKKR